MTLVPYLEDFGPFVVGDAPTGSFTVEFTEAGEGIVAAIPADVIEALILDPSGLSVDVAIEREGSTDPDFEEEFVSALWPDGFVFSMPGVWSFVTRTAGTRSRARRFVVEGFDGWHTLDTARESWADARQLDDVTLYNLLRSARTQCAEFAPKRLLTPFPEVVVLQAQLMQARALARSLVAQANDTIGEGDFAVTVFPLDHTIRALLRPKRATPGRI